MALSLYSTVVAKTRYARWNTDANRREHFDETCDRYFDFFEGFLAKNYGHNVDPIILHTLRDSMVNLDIMPSMRSLMVAGPALEAVQAANYNCLSGKTMILTREHGAVPISTVAGHVVHVLDGDGKWTEAPVDSYGVQAVRTVTFSHNSKILRSVDVTDDHDWVTARGRVKTHQLRPGDRIAPVVASRPASNNIDYARGVVHGLVYGDGTRVKRKIASIITTVGYKIRLCGDHDDLLPYFTQLGYKPAYYPYMNGDPIIELVDDNAKVNGMKNLPENTPTTTPSYVLGFIRGWLAADGSTSAHGQTVLCTTAEGREWLHRWAPTVGLVLAGSSLLSAATNFGVRGRATYTVRFASYSVLPQDHIIQRKRERVKDIAAYPFSVKEIDSRMRAEEVFCARVPTTQSFVIEGSLLTGNCAFLPLDAVRAFSEMMYVLMSGGGVGFSVERKFTDKLPEIPDTLEAVDDVIVVGDSREGWCKAYNKFLSLLWGGHIPSWDVSNVRPAGARLKTFGGYASGPEPLESLFKHTLAVFQKAKGRRLRPIEAFSVATYVAQIVVVGGVRRAATIALFDLDDLDMRNAKGANSQMYVMGADGKWVPGPNAHYAMANISAVFESKPDMRTFFSFWQDLMNGGFGEPGIFNREAFRQNATTIGRPNTYANGSNIPWGANPCSLPADQFIMLEGGPKRIGTLIGKGPQSVVVNGVTYPSTPFIKTGTKEVFDVRTDEGFIFSGSDDHPYQLTDESWVLLRDLRPGQKVKVHAHRGELPKLDTDAFERGWLLGEVTGDGGFNPPKYPTYLRFWGDEVSAYTDYADALIKKHCRIDAPVTYGEHPRTVRDPQSLVARGLDALAAPYLEVGTKEHLPALEEESVSFVRGYLRGYFDAGGTVGYGKGLSVRLGSVSYTRLQSVQRMLARLGIFSKIYPRKLVGKTLLPNGQGGKDEYSTQAFFELAIGRDSVDRFAHVVGFSAVKQQRLDEELSRRTRKAYKDKFYATVKDITLRGVEDVYDAEVAVVKCFDANGVMAHNCEIQLRPYQFCNLSGVAIREADTLEDLKRKVEQAAILGTWQACVSDFAYLRKIWKENVEEERLLGVCLSGFYDHPVLSTTTDECARWLQELKAVAVETNRIWAAKLGINVSACVTSVKPAGNSGELYDTASGIHPRWSPYYIRRLRQSNTDPMTRFLSDNGIPSEPSKQAPDRDTILSFPQKAPDSATIFAGTLGAIEQLEHWVHVKKNWATHTVSCTIYIREHEWMEAGAWVYKHFDEITGLAFLPYDSHRYEQAPYEAITKEQYEAMVADFPTAIDWDLFKHYDVEDITATGQEVACIGGACALT